MIDKLKVRSRRDVSTFIARGLVYWDDMWKGATVDTENPEFARRFGYSDL